MFCDPVFLLTDIMEDSVESCRHLFFTVRFTSMCRDFLTHFVERRGFCISNDVVEQILLLSTFFDLGHLLIGHRALWSKEPIMDRIEPHGFVCLVLILSISFMKFI